MSSSSPPIHAAPPRVALPRWARLRRSLTGAALLAAGGLAWWWLTTHHFTGVEEPSRELRQPAGSATGSVADAIVAVAPGTAGAAEIGLVPVEMRKIREHLTVPGRLDYDARSRLDYASPVDGIVSRVFVQVREKVGKGASLAEVSSPDVGMARDEVRKREADREIEKKAADWAVTIADNVAALLEVLASQPPLETVEQQFKGRLLGAYREKILGTYSRLVFVEKVNASTKQLGEGGVLSGRIIEERTSNLEVARASFAASCESARFDTLQERDKARADLEQTERLLLVAKENLRNLVGGRLDDATIEEGPPPEDGISAIALRTPFDGVVEEVFVSRGERVQGGDRMFVVADTSRLWVRAQVHEKQWTTLQVAEGQEVRVIAPGAEEHRTKARINHIGATVDATSRSVPIVADLENDDAHYKPGMFVWVELPQGETHDAATVPVAAVMRHEGKPFVFVPAADGFRRVDVVTGLESDDVVEIVRGLEPGQDVVARGAFLLKSELLLEDEG